jgi:hypothetical protein
MDLVAVIEEDPRLGEDADFLAAPAPGRLGVEDAQIGRASCRERVS